MTSYLTAKKADNPLRPFAHGGRGDGEGEQLRGTNRPTKQPALPMKEGRKVFLLLPSLSLFLSVFGPNKTVEELFTILQECA